jgi:peptidoglycan/xylan/chitin deacetylase (PgdA/CDA1 family)
MGVKHLFNSVPCDDGNPATANDWCQDGVCKGAAQVCPKGDYYPVGGLCLLCKADGSGPVGPGSAVDDGNVCTDDFCDPGDGILHWDNGQPCDDGNPATKWDWCHSGGKCYGTPVVCDAGDYFVKEGLCWLCNGSGTGTVGAGLAIDDGNLCTDDACDPGGGVEHYFNHAPCSDGKPDTLLDTCNDGTCIGVPKLCPPNEWVNTGGWWCILCDATGTQWANDGVDVDDVEDCTEDICDPKAGVIHTPVEGECWDADECTENDTCSNGKCAGTPIDCFDDNVCSQDGCDPATGQCTYQAVAGKCNDGLAATPDDVCVGVVCVGMLDPDGDKIPNYGTGPKCDGPGLLVNCQDNCPYRANATQVDSNNDGTGDACTEPRWWMRVATTKKVVALTFDDGWDNDAFEAILDALAAEKAYATFFFSGLYLDDWTIEPPTLIRAEKAGHLLGNHTFHHKLGGSLGETVQELLLCDQEFVAAGVGSVRPLFRPAGTELALWINIALQQTLFTEAFFANFDASDWLAPEPPAAALTQCILDKVAPGDIIDLHVGPEVTPAALPQILKGLKAAGYEMLTVEQMLAFGQPELVAVDAVKTCEDYF